MRRHDRTDGLPQSPTSFSTSYLQPLQTPSPSLDNAQTIIITQPDEILSPHHDYVQIAANSTAKGILIGVLSAFGSAAIVIIILTVVFFFRYTRQGRILLDRLGRPGEYDDEQAFAREEAEALEEMDDLQRTEYMRAKAFIQANPPESVQTDISLSQFLAIQEKGVSAWEFEPELEIANCFVEGRTEIEFFDSECSVQSNLPIPKQNEVYYWEAKIYDKPESTLISIGLTTKPYPLFRLPGWHKHSIAYTSHGSRRHNQPFTPTPYGPAYVQGDVIGCGYRPRTGTVFFTRNGKKLDDVAHGLKTPNFFPTVGANGPCQVHVNFGQLGFVFIEANVKKWGLAPMTGSLAPPPPYGSEQGSILLEGGREGVREGMGLGGYVAAAAAGAGGGFRAPGHVRTSSSSQQVRLARHPASPGPQRSPTDISLAQLSLVDSHDEDAGEGASSAVAAALAAHHPGQATIPFEAHPGVPIESAEAPPEYESPESTPGREAGGRLGRRDGDEEGDGDGDGDGERRLLLRHHHGEDEPPIPSYDDALAETRRGRSGTR